MDAFSEILAGVKLNGALFFHANFSAPWAYDAPPSKTLAPALAPGAPHLIVYHFLIEGTAIARVGGQTISLVAGDIVIFPHGDPHLFASGGEPYDGSEAAAAVHRKIMTRDLTALRTGGGGEVSRFVCGYMACDPHLSRPILNGLPKIFKVNIRTDPSGKWLENSILQLVEEAGSGRVGSEAMLAKLSEALFVDTLRRYVAGLPEPETGWLAGARDPAVGKCLALMHGRIDHPWTIADLANQVGVSRSALSDRFMRYLSEPPMTYLTRWRLQLAARALTKTPRGVAEIGFGVGYESEAAFNRAFKREFGQPPARYRREQRISSDEFAEASATGGRTAPEA
ncbi:MAG TPA: AraC family transcriptional regulator [Terracidiphilus sp.]